MISSKSIDDLTPEIKQKAIQLKDLAKKNGIDIIFTSTYRDNEAQAELYKQGRTTGNKIVTNSNAGDSYHNYRIAFDIVPMINKKPIWNDDDLWKKLGSLGESIGLTWGGRFNSIVDKPHFQKSGITLAELKKKIIDTVKKITSSEPVKKVTSTVKKNPEIVLLIAGITIFLIYKKMKK